MDQQGASKAGRIVWHDLMTVDLEKSKEFYTSLFGWTLFQQEMGPIGSYTVIKHRGEAIGGMVATDPRHGVSTHWLTYITVEDVDSLCGRIKDLGGKVAVEPRGVPGAGNFAILQDPQETVFSAIQTGEEMPAPARSKEHGSLYWDQLLTPRSDRMAKFYGEVCGWTVDRHDMGDLGYYGIFKRSGEAVAGMLPVPDDEKWRQGWRLYIYVDDLDGTAKKAEELGGEIVGGPDTIQGVGTYTVVRDVTKGVFGLFRAAS